MKPLSIGEKVLGQAEQGALLSWTEALESGQLPTRWPINLWFALFLFRLNKGWSALLISHMSDAPLQQDVLPPPGCQAEQVAVLHLPHLSDDLKEVAVVVRGDLDCVGRELLRHMCPEQGC